MNKDMKMLAVLMTCSAAAGLTSCADGYKDEGTFQSDVRNTQLTSPVLDKSCFSTISTSDGDRVQMEWPLVMGAGGYQVSVAKQNGDQLIPVITDSIVDGVSVTFKKEEDTKYLTTVKALGNKRYNNTDAADASNFVFSTMIEGISIPEGSDVAQFINSYISAHASEMEAALKADPKNYEVAFEMEAGKQYTLNECIDLQLYPVTLRSADRISRATVTVGANGYITTQAGLKVKFVNFDCTEMNKKVGLLTLSETPDASISTEALGYKALGGNQDGFVIEKPVMMQECMVKNLPTTLLFGNKQNWTLRSFSVKDCIIQAANKENNTPWINMTGASNGLIQKLNIENSTFYNTERNETEQYFMRFSNASNAQPKKIFGANDNFLEYTIKNSSLIRTNPKKDFANNMPNTQNGSSLWINIENSVFFDVFRLYQLLQSQWVKTTTGNFMSYSSFCEPTSTDYGPGGRTDNKGNFYTTLCEEQAYQEEALQPLDLTKPNGGVNLKATGIAAGAGDPRW